MQGLLSQPEQGQEQPQGQPQGDQRQLDNFVMNGMDIIHNPQTRDAVLENLKHGEPSDAVAGLAWTVLQKLESSAEESGKPLDDNTKIQGGNALIGEIVNLGEQAGLFKMDEEERALSLQKVVAKYMEREIKAGRIDPQQLKQVGLQAGQKLGLDFDGAHQKLQGAMGGGQ